SGVIIGPAGWEARIGCIAQVFIMRTRILYVSTSNTGRASRAATAASSSLDHFRLTEVFFRAVEHRIWHVNLMSDGFTVSQYRALFSVERVQIAGLQCLDLWGYRADNL